MVELKHAAEFRAVLENYELNSKAKDLLEKAPLVIMLGITGAGRNTIINHLRNTGNYHYIVSDTTRPPKLRDGHMEQDGVAYNFRSEEAMLDDLRAGCFLEAEIIHEQQVSGINTSELEVALSSQKVPINEVDVGGTQSIRLAKPDTKFFFVIPPSYKEWLYRLQGREVMSQEEFANRRQTAIKVLREGLELDDFVFIVNDSSRRSAEEIDAQVSGRSVSQSSHQEGRSVAKQILAELEANA